MQFTLYHESRGHKKTCAFEVADPDDRTKLKPCGGPAIGVGGRQPLCEEHFEYYRGIRRGELRHESPKK